MSRPLIVNEAAAGDLRGKGKTRTVAFAHSLQCDNVKEWLDPSIKFSPSQQDPEADHRTSSRTTHNPLPHCCHPAQIEAAGSGLNQVSWCSVHTWGTAKASMVCLKYKNNVTNNQVGPCNAYVHVCACTPQPHIYKNANKKSGCWGLLKAPTGCSKLHFENQTHNTIRQPISKNNFCDFSLRCSKDFGEKVFLLYLLFCVSELTSPDCISADRKAPCRQEVTFWQLCLPGALPRKDWPGCWVQLQPCSPFVLRRIG